MKNIIINSLFRIKVDLIFEKIINLYFKLKLKRLEKRIDQKINFCKQGEGFVDITSRDNNFSKFNIHETSHLKSATYIECSDGVKIGRYFHTGRGLTIFSTNHNYESNEYIPYDFESIIRPVIIEDFVWCGSNVTK